jgi:hypothetical protein
MGNKFCKFIDTDKQSYVIIDNNKQPLACENNTCVISNYQKVIDYPSRFNDLKLNTINENTGIPCDYKMNGVVNNINVIDPDLYKFATYYSAGASGIVNQDTEPIYYIKYNGLIDDKNKIKYSELKKRHDDAKKLFKEVVIKAQYAKKADDKTLSIIEERLMQNNLQSKI